eukprot:Amastigsp_a841269_24.p5 type:complete len:113 gc:universal Amastigsp_a841269_24:1882-1544(-)
MPSMSASFFVMTTRRMIFCVGVSSPVATDRSPGRKTHLRICCACEIALVALYCATTLSTKARTAAHACASVSVDALEPSAARAILTSAGRASTGAPVFGSSSWRRHTRSERN